MSPSRRIQGILLDHFWWKLSALLLASLLWVATSDEPEVISTLAVPVEYKNVPAGFDIATDVADVTERVMLQVRGPASTLAAASANQRMAVVVDVAEGSTGHGGGARTYTIGSPNVQLPANAVLLRAVPGQIRLTLERRLQKEVPVHLRYSGPPPPGFRVKIGEVSPERIRIVGPESKVKAIEAVDTDPLDLLTIDRVADRPVEVMLNTFIADSHVSPAGSSVIRARVQLEKLNE